MNEIKSNLSEYLSESVKNIVASAVKSTLTNPRESIYMASFAASSRAASRKRAKSEMSGEHIPPFLIASITDGCNMHCAGCFARGIHTCSDEQGNNQLTAEEWESIFKQSADLGVSFIFLAGGEPLLRKDVMQKAANTREILFPVITNGTLIGDDYMKLFDKSRNLLPVFSIEGKEAQTDARRGSGVYKNLISTMEELNRRGLVFGASVTVTTENLNEVFSHEFISVLSERGCKVVFFIEYVPVTADSGHLAPQDAEREIMRKKSEELKADYPDMMFISFPGDEESFGSCLAAGRGFFHINAHGGAEPCPFSPYSDINVRDMSVKEALNSKLFAALQNDEVLSEHHSGGCVLYEQREQVERLVNAV